MRERRNSRSKTRRRCVLRCAEILAIIGAAWILIATFWFQYQARFLNSNSEPKFQATLSLNWSSYLSRSDPVWHWTTSSSAPHFWNESTFLGNGRLGLMIWTQQQGSSSSAVVFELGRTSLYDDRTPDKPYYTNNFVFDKPRLPIGRFLVETSTENGDLRLDLFNAETRGKIGNNNKENNELTFTSFVHSEDDVIVVKFNEKKPIINFQPANCQSSWALNPKWKGNVTATLNPQPIISKSGRKNFVTQKLLSGNSFTTAWEIIQDKETSSFILFVTISSICKNSPKEVFDTLSRSIEKGYTKLIKSHRKWWNDYYPQSFLTLSDSKIESFYWIQMYKLASGTRENKDLFDLQGPWTVDGSFWPDLHWDLNLQLTYWPVYTSNRLKLGMSLIKYLDSHISGFIKNVPPDWRLDSAAVPATGSALDGLTSCYWDHGENCYVTPPSITGNLLWILHNYYLQYLHSRNKELLHSLFPLLKRAVNFYSHFQYVGKDGLVHLPTTFSPEFTVNRGPDTHYDLALLRWGLQHLLLIVDILKIEDPLIPKWRNTLEKLAPFPTNSRTGFLVSEGVPLNESHRHFSHLFAVYPLSSLTNWNDKSHVSLATKSVDWWASKSDFFQGYSLSALSTMSTILGRKQAAWGNLTLLINKFLHVNTMYSEMQSPCGETPLAAASALQDMLLMSNEEGTISIFPGIPDYILSSASFWHFGTQTGLLISAKRDSKGFTEFVEIENRRNTMTKCSIVHGLRSPLLVLPGNTNFFVAFDGSISLEVPPKSKIILCSGQSPSAASLKFEISPSKMSLKEANIWGKH